MVADGVQAIFGTDSENLKTDMEIYLKQKGIALKSGPKTTAVPSPAIESAPQDAGLKAKAEAVRAALGGGVNILSIEAVALTRLRIQLKEDSKMKRDDLLRAGVDGVQIIQPGLLHLMVGQEALSLATQMKET